MVPPCVVLFTAAVMLTACGSGSNGNASAFCAGARALQNSNASINDQDPASIASAEKAFRALIPKAPSAIRGDVKTVADALDQTNAGKISEVQKNADKIDAAEQHVATYLHDKCGITEST
ncbi:MAG TPA: hypothetical protein VFR41_02045 [Acidimicrobiia bacterium]|nr:hypothetical protein [Acidimicrobiia bacterium]